MAGYHLNFDSLPARRRPNLQSAVSRSEHKVAVGRQQLQLVTHAELRNDGVNGADLQPGATASIAQVCGVDVILPVRRQKRQGGESVNDVFARTRAGKSLQQFLQDGTCDHDGSAAVEGVAQ
jgi:hypothetical protein